ncbi:hypothetical protein DNFV4_02440 [Nitrospira tepida]|uniref:Uncharacterized protein n=1 Tax=Nitrospira tepida TaxID=2973512 RepID=A0AA86MZX0_9BACT|nr:hypothetical protein [Nitrospira tepida]CAI4032015.1 hypothetical protein DNFV4_02440 [Nitrospira tepida]
MNPADTLMLDAKQAILDEAHRRFLVLQEEGRSEEAMQQFQVTLSCASDLLNESLQILERVLAEQQRAEQDPSDSPGDKPLS